MISVVEALAHRADVDGGHTIIESRMTYVNVYLSTFPKAGIFTCANCSILFVSAVSVRRFVGPQKRRFCGPVCRTRTMARDARRRAHAAKAAQ